MEQKLQEICLLGDASYMTLGFPGNVWKYNASFNSPMPQ